MNYTLPKEVKIILDKFQKAKFQIYIVGGAVRDILMEKEVSDWDFTSDAKPEEILKLFPDGFYDNKFGTVGIQLSAISYQLSDKKQKKAENRRLTTDSSLFEITTMRKEGIYKDHRHPINVSWTNKIEEDLARRDFTINAIALKYQISNIAPSPPTPPKRLRRLEKLWSVGDKYQIVDPFHGQADIENKIIRAVGEPSKRFQEDALRLIRAVRFATQLGFDIDPETSQSIKETSSLIEEIAWERIRDELFKILESVNPYKGIVILREAGILQIILPELEKCFGLIQQGPKHDRVYDIGEHSLLTLKYTPSSDPLVRLSALLHDIGKPETVATQPDGNVTFYGHDVVGGKLVLNIAKRFNLSKKQIDKLFSLVRFHMFTVDERQTDSAIRRFIRNVGMGSIEDMLALRVGDRLGGGTQIETSWRMKKFKQRIKEVLKKPFTISDLKINGNDVMKLLNIKSGPRVGEILKKLFEEVLEDSSKNKREYLLERLKKTSMS